MKDKLKEAFDQVKAGNELKDKTYAFLENKTKYYTRARMINYRHFVSAAACLILVLIGSHWIYFTPTAEISIDINPSIELGINRFDKVISVTGYNNDGLELISSLDLKFTNYALAVDEILKNETVSTLLSDDELLTITVVSQDDTQASKILSDMETCAAHHQNTHCYLAHSEEVEAAHEAGLSYGKYKAFLKIQALDPSITPEQIQDLTMKEIQDLIDTLSSDNENEIMQDDNGQDNHHGNGYEYRHGHTNGKNCDAVYSTYE